jgi:hypothetical protein
MSTQNGAPGGPGKGKSAYEEIKVEGDRLVAMVKDLLREGNVRRIIIKNEEGKVIIEVPLTFGLVGAILVPSLAAIGAVAALVSDCTIAVERKEG